MHKADVEATFEDAIESSLLADGWLARVNWAIRLSLAWIRPTWTRSSKTTQPEQVPATDRGTRRNRGGAARIGEAGRQRKSMTAERWTCCVGA